MMKITGVREIDILPADGTGSDNGVTNIILTNGDVVALNAECVNYLNITVNKHYEVIVEIDIMERSVAR